MEEAEVESLTIGRRLLPEVLEAAAWASHCSPSDLLPNS